MKKMLRLCILFLCLISCLGVFLAGCSSVETKAEPEAATVVITDSAGREVEIPKNIQRIAPSGPLAQIVLYTVAPDKLVGWSIDLSDAQKEYIPEKYWDLPVFGQFYGKNVSLNLEALIAADPQVIFDIGEAKDTIAEDMEAIQEQSGIPTVFIEADFDNMAAAYRTLGEILNVEESAQAQADYIEDTLTHVDEIAASIAEGDKVGVYFGTGETGLNANAKGSFHAKALDRVGVENVTVIEEVSSAGGGNTINMEQLLKFDPDMIILDNSSCYESIATDSLWRDVRAVQNDNYYLIPVEPYNWVSDPPSVNSILGLKWLGNLAYPDLYEYDMVKEAREFYQLFYHYDLTEQEAKYMLKNSTIKKQVQ